MKHFIARGRSHVAICSARNEVEAARILIALLEKAEEKADDIEVLEFDPTLEGGVLLRIDGNGSAEVARI